MAVCNERFLCDEMLGRLGRWLRAAGYDVVIASAGETDSKLLQRACEEARLLLTRDRKIGEYRDAAGRVVLLEGNRLSEQFQELSWACSIDWLCRPFSRCLECNSELVVADEVIRQRVATEALRNGETLLYCPNCDQPYWHGSHVRRMRHKLEQLALGIWDGSVDDGPGFNNKEKPQ